MRQPLRHTLGRAGFGRALRSARARATSGAPRPSPRRQRWDPTQTSALYASCEGEAGTRPQYLWPLLHATHAARALGVEAISTIEFGVAGGSGLLAMERAAEVATALSGTRVEIFGFDTGLGMPASSDPRDAPWLIEPSLFRMDEAALRARLRRAQLVLGPVAETVPAWSQAGHPPVGFVAFDLDYYTSTRDALRLLRDDSTPALPRVLCYFDDLFGYGWSEFTGVHAALEEFNASGVGRKIGKIHGLRFELPPREFNEQWHEKLFVAHLFDHPQYAEPEGKLDERWVQAHRLPER